MLGSKSEIKDGVLKITRTSGRCFGLNKRIDGRGVNLLLQEKNSVEWSIEISIGFDELADALAGGGWTLCI